MLWPAVVPESGPFAGRRMHWSEPESSLNPDTRAAAIAFYLAMMTAECLDLAGSVGPVIVEGPFARNTPYLQMLGVATGSEILSTRSQTGTSVGAAMLASKQPSSITHEKLARTPRMAHCPPDSVFRSYARLWREAL
nr:hypothetical protein [Acidimangrovimonas sediminis]